MNDATILIKKLRNRLVVEVSIPKRQFVRDKKISISVQEICEFIKNSGYNDYKLYSGCSMKNFGKEILLFQTFFFIKNK